MIGSQNVSLHSEHEIELNQTDLLILDVNSGIFQIVRDP